MPRKRFTNEQIAFALRQAENGATVGEVCRKMGVSDPGEAGGQVRHEASLARDTISLSITPASSPSAFRDMSKWPKSS